MIYNIEQKQAVKSLKQLNCFYKITSSSPKLSESLQYTLGYITYAFMCYILSYMCDCTCQLVCLVLLALYKKMKICIIKNIKCYINYYLIFMYSHDNNNNNTMHKLAFHKETLSKIDQKFVCVTPQKVIPLPISIFSIKFCSYIPKYQGYQIFIRKPFNQTL